MDGSMPTPQLIEHVESIRASVYARRESTQQASVSPQIEFLICGLADPSLKDDMATMEAPVFTLATKEDLKVWRWESEDGTKSVEVAPSVYGRASMHDKDVLIYITSHLMAAINQGEEPGRTCRFTAYDYLKTTGKNTWADDYKRLKLALDRLAGTRIKTNIKAGGRRIIKSFGLIDTWEIVENSPSDARMVAIRVTLSEWLYGAIAAREVLTIDPAYFSLRKPLERRLYEIARKHVGKQGIWEISLEALKQKCGSTTARLRDFKSDVDKIIESIRLPGYQMELTEDGKVVFYARDLKQLVAGVEKGR